MPSGYLSIDENSRVQFINGAALDYACAGSGDAAWYKGGEVHRNDCVFYWGEKYLDLFRRSFGISLLEGQGRKKSDLPGKYIILAEYGLSESIPFVKKTDSADLRGDRRREDEGAEIVDTYFMGDHVSVSRTEKGVRILVGEQEYRSDVVPEEFLLIWDHNGIRYFSDPVERPGAEEAERRNGLPYSESQEILLEEAPFRASSIPEVLNTHTFGPFMDLPSGQPVRNIFGESAERVFQTARREPGIHIARNESGNFCIRRIAFEQGGGCLFSLSGEKSAVEEMTVLYEAYDVLYRRRLIQIRNNALTCDARLQGTSRGIVEINKRLEKVCRKNVTLILLGESGTGKTYLARKIHNNSSRARKAFVNVNCAAIPSSLFESELFGYEEGAFTGARHGGRQGYFEMAKGGTLFLDEITELPLNLQSKLLEVLQEGTFYRVGGTKKIQADVRLMVATNKNLKQLVQTGEFREDLFYRIFVFPIQLPPLRDRMEDIYSIVADILPDICSRLESEPLMLTQDAYRKLGEHDWPGNIRELQNVLENAAVMTEDCFIRSSDISFDQNHIAKRRAVQLKERLSAYEKEILEEAYEKFGGNRRQIADYLGVSKTNLFDKLHKYGIGAAE